MKRKNAHFSGRKDYELQLVPRSIPTPIEVSGGLTSSFTFQQLCRTPDTLEAELSYDAWRQTDIRSVLSPKCTHLRVRRQVFSDGAAGFSRWKVRILERDEVEQVGERNSGAGQWMLRHDGPPKKIRITWNDGQLPGSLTFYEDTDTGRVKAEAPLKTAETFTFRKSGYILLRADKWDIAMM